MKQWVRKLLEQFEIGGSESHIRGHEEIHISEDRATILHVIDTLSKHLFELDMHPLRKVRETLDDLAKGIAHHDEEVVSKALFRFRQFFASYRIDEYTYLHNTFDDFKNIIWDFADQLGEDLKFEKKHDQTVKHHLDDLREAVESNSIEGLRSKSREFIDSYIELQSVKDHHRHKRFENFQASFTSMKKQLMDAKQTMMQDHLTGAYNRRSFDEQLKKYISMRSLSPSNVTMIAIDIDHFKKVNDTYGHDVGDFILKECVRILKSVFQREQDFIARIGGEEFVVLLPDYKIEHAVIKAEELRSRVLKEVFLHGENKIQFTVSMGISQLSDSDSAEQWLKRADQALYHSKQSGRNKFTIGDGTNLKAVS